MKRSKIIASTLALALVVTSVCVPNISASAAKKVALNKKTASIAVGESVKLSVKNGKKTAKVTWKTANKKIAKITQKTTKGNTAKATIKGVKKGTVKVTAVYKLKKKSTKFVCKVIVGSAKNTQKPATVTTSASVAPTVTSTAAVIKSTNSPAASIAPTAAATATTKATPTKKPTATPTKKPTATPAPTAEPALVNPYTVDISDASIVTGENGGSAAYNPETKAIESDMKGMQGFIVFNPIKEKASEYCYVKLTYTLGSSDVNAYVGDETLEGTGTGEKDPAWSDIEYKLNQYTMDEETNVTILLSVKDLFSKEDGANSIKALKFFDFGDDAKMSIKSITYYMDGNKSAQDKFSATKKSDDAITVDGIASEADWANAQEYAFVSKVPLNGIAPTDTDATVKFLYDAENMYFFVDVTDSSIDASSENNYDRDGLEILFDEDNCQGEGAGDAKWGDTNKDGLHYRATGIDTKAASDSALTASTSDIQGGGTDGITKTGIEVKYALTANGYSMEGKIPFAVSKVGGEEIGMDIIVQDCKGGTRQNEFYMTYTKEAKVYWNNTSAKFGIIVLKPDK